MAKTKKQKPTKPEESPEEFAARINQKAKRSGLRSPFRWKRR